MKSSRTVAVEGRSVVDVVGDEPVVLVEEASLDSLLVCNLGRGRPSGRSGEYEKPFWTS